MLATASIMMACEQALCLGKGWKNRAERERIQALTLSLPLLEIFFHLFPKQSACSQANIMTSLFTWLNLIGENFRGVVFLISIESPRNTEW